MDLTPLFCSKTKEKRSGRSLFINFKSSRDVPAPDLDFDEDRIVRLVCISPDPDLENFKIPLKLSQIFWTKERNKDDRNYVIDAQINDKFALRRVIVSEIFRHYVLTVVMASIEEKFNATDSTKLSGQFIGHDLDLDQLGYEILKDKISIDMSDELVNNKIIVIDESKGLSSNPILTKEDKESAYDLHFRPASMLLTCSIRTDKLPDSISFNDDRICVRSGEDVLLDVYLPLYIELTHPVKYKFDDRLCLFRIVFKMVESLL